MLAALLLSAILGACASTSVSSRRSDRSDQVSSRRSERSDRVSGSTAPIPTPATRAERTNYLETSHYADVVAFLDSLKSLGAAYQFGSIGKTFEGRDSSS